jgi:alpha-tubulin suppressor-like RCC1 family protein
MQAQMLIRKWVQRDLAGNTVSECVSLSVLQSLLGKHVVQIAQGWSHTAVLLESGELMQYGNRIGTGLNEDYVVPTITSLMHLHVSEKPVCAKCSE